MNQRQRVHGARRSQRVRRVSGSSLRPLGSLGASLLAAATSRLTSIALAKISLQLSPY